MNIFEKKLQKAAVESLPLNPIELYQTCPYKEGFGYLRGIQEEVLKSWHQNRNQRDVICKMNTGSGKTLTGLLMLYSKMVEGVGPCVYVCPDNHLVDQTVRFAGDYGIPVCTFDATNALPLDFLNGKGILVCNFYKLFNGKSVFKRFNVEIGAILIDDAHKCVDIARDQSTISIPRNHKISKKLFNLFSDALKHQSKGNYALLENEDPTILMKVPYWAWFENQEAIISVINNYVSEIEKDPENSEGIKFSWNLIVDNLNAYDCYISGKSFEIAPIHVPYQEMPALSEAKHRYILSATFEDDYDLLKDLGIAYESILNPIVPSDRRDVGKRLILAPSRFDSKLTDEIVRGYISKYPREGYNTVVLVPSEIKAEPWKALGAIVVKRENIDSAITQLGRSKKNFMVFVNRYDGIDLTNDLCRILVIDGLPNHYSLRDAYAEIRLESLKAGRKAQIIEQGLGRATRSGSDHSVVFLMGTDLLNFIGVEKNLSHFTPITKAQIKLGLNLLDEEQSNDSLKTIKDTANYCLTNDSSWLSYHSHALRSVNQGEIDDARKHIMLLAETEREALDLFRKRKFEDSSKVILNKIIKPDDITAKEMAWYYQLAAQLMYLGNRVTSNDLQIKACNITTRMFHPQNQHIYKKLKSKDRQASSINKFLKQFERPQDVQNTLEDILNTLKYDPQIDSNYFERSLARLGGMLGFSVQMPERELGNGPDVLWCLSDNHFLIQEAKSNAVHDAISRSDIEQLLHSETWFKSIYNNEVYSLVTLQSSRKKGDKVTIPLNATVIDKDALELLHSNVRQFFSVLLQGHTDSNTDEEIAQLLVAYKLTSELFRQTYLKSIK